MALLGSHFSNGLLGHDWYAERETYRRIGLWLLHLLFSGRTFAGLTLTHPESRIETLWVLLSRPELPSSGALHVSGPLSFTGYDHFVQPVARHPFADPPMGGVERVNGTDRPMFRFGWSDPEARHAALPEQADEVILSLTPEGLAALASLLLDLAVPASDALEVNLEPPFVGFGGTQPLSLEARLWLPGSFGFPAATLAEMSFRGVHP